MNTESATAPKPTGEPPAIKPHARRGLAKTRFVWRWAWRTTKAVAVLVLLALILGSGWIAWTNYRGQSAVDRLLAEFSESISPARDADPIAPENNGARYMIAAAEVFVLPEHLEENTPILGFANWPEFGQTMTEDQRELLAGVIELNQAGYDLTEKAFRAPAIDFDLNVADGLDPSLKTFGDLRRVGRWHYLRHLRYLSEGDHETAVDAIVDILNTARALRNERNQFAGLIEISIQAMARGAVEDMLSRTEVEEADLYRLQIAVENALRRIPLIERMKYESLNNLYRLQDPDEFLNYAIHQEAEISPHLEKMAEAIAEGLGGVHENQETWVERWIDRIGLAYYRLCPGAVQLAACRELEWFFTAADQLNKSDQLDQSFLDRAEEEGIELLGAIEASLRTERLSRTLLTCTVYALEAEKFRLREGRWPKNINELPTHNVEPIDPWGNHLRIRVTETGVRIYSLGGNGQDDGGIDRWDDYDMADYDYEEPDDWNIRLLNTELRGNLASVAVEESDLDNEVNGFDNPFKFESATE